MNKKIACTTSLETKRVIPHHSQSNIDDLEDREADLGDSVLINKVSIISFNGRFSSSGVNLAHSALGDRRTDGVQCSDIVRFQAQS